MTPCPHGIGRCEKCEAARASAQSYPTVEAYEKACACGQCYDSLLTHHRNLLALLRDYRDGHTSDLCIRTVDGRCHCALCERAAKALGVEVKR